jgi:hypothetical protein
VGPCHRCRSQYLIAVPEVISDNPSLQEILWNFSRYKNKKQRLTLSENPHFYADLPTSPDAYEDGVEINPTEDFQHTDVFYVLIDRPNLVCIMTDQDTRYFGNFWCPQNAVIFKGLGVLFYLFFLCLMSCQTSVGGSRVNVLSRHLSQAQSVGYARSPPSPP